jgi:hypothetical protein
VLTVKEGMVQLTNEGTKVRVLRSDPVQSEGFVDASTKMRTFAGAELDEKAVTSTWTLVRL